MRPLPDYVHTAARRSRSSGKQVPAGVAGAADAAAIALFAGVGRASHGRGDAWWGLMSTAWPFWVGAVLGWIAVTSVTRHAPTRVREGVVVWATTLVVGMALRVLTDQGTAASFVVVAALVLAALLLGWRLVLLPLTRR